MSERDHMRKIWGFHPPTNYFGDKKPSRKTGCAHCDDGRKIIYLPNDPEALPYHDNGSPTLHPCVATVSSST